jgi:hypothetical protein
MRFLALAFIGLLGLAVGPSYAQRVRDLPPEQPTQQQPQPPANSVDPKIFSLEFFDLGANMSDKLILAMDTFRLVECFNQDFADHEMNHINDWFYGMNSGDNPKTKAARAIMFVADADFRMVAPCEDMKAGWNGQYVAMLRQTTAYKQLTDMFKNSHYILHDINKFDLHYAHCNLAIDGKVIIDEPSCRIGSGDDGDFSFTGGDYIVEVTSAPYQAVGGNIGYVLKGKGHTVNIITQEQTDLGYLILRTHSCWSSPTDTTNPHPEPVHVSVCAEVSQQAAADVNTANDKYLKQQKQAKIDVENARLASYQYKWVYGLAGHQLSLGQSIWLRESHSSTYTSSCGRAVVGIQTAVDHIEQSRDRGDGAQYAQSELASSFSSLWNCNIEVKAQCGRAAAGSDLATMCESFADHEKGAETEVIAHFPTLTRNFQ